MDDDNLTDRQLRFVFEYLQDHNASAAAVRAGYSERSRSSAAHELMNHPGVQARLREEMASLLGELRCSALSLMKERARAAFFRPGRMLKGNWEMRDLDEMEPEVLEVLEVSSVMRKSGPVLKVKQPDRDRALRALERVHEKLDRLNEKYWDRLEREGKSRSLEEIEAMAQADDLEEARTRATQPVAQARPGQAAPGLLVSGRDFSGKTLGFPGSAAAGGPRAGVFAEKTMVFSGSAAGAGALAGKFPEKTMDLLGGAGAPPRALPLPRPQASPWLLNGRERPGPKAAMKGALAAA